VQIWFDSPREDALMTTAHTREDLTEHAGGTGWEHRHLDRVDVFHRGLTRIRVIWGGDSMSGASLFQDDVLTTYTRDPATVTGWLSRG
jgi:hypothetical protein